jgi:hypothetical protein
MGIAAHTMGETISIGFPQGTDFGVPILGTRLSIRVPMAILKTWLFGNCYFPSMVGLAVSIYGVQNFTLWGPNFNLCVHPQHRRPNAV